MSKYTVVDEGFRWQIENGQARGYQLYLRKGADTSCDYFADAYLQPLCPHIRAAKTTAEAQAICDGVVTIGPYTVDYRNPESMVTIGVPGDYVAGIYSPIHENVSLLTGTPFDNKVAHAKTPAEVLTILKESLVPQSKKFTAVAPEDGSQSIRVLNGHKYATGGPLYLGRRNTVSAKWCVVPELAGVIDALIAAPTVAVAQAIIDAHLAEPPKEAKVTLEVKDTVDFTVILDDEGRVVVDCKYWRWVNDDEPDTHEHLSPVDHVVDRLDLESPSTIAEAVAIIEGCAK